MGKMAYAFTVNPYNNQVTWGGFINDFTLEFSAIEVSESTIKAKGFLGNIDDIITVIQVDGFGKLKTDTRCGTIDGHQGPAFYYGVVSSYEEDEITKVTCKDIKYFLQSNYVLEPVTDAQKASDYNSDPFTWMQKLTEKWLLDTEHENRALVPITFKELSGKPWPTNKAGTKRDFSWPSNSSTETEAISSKFISMFGTYQVAVIPYGDTLRQGEQTAKMVPYQLIHLAPIYGDPQYTDADLPTLIIDKSIYIKEPDVYVRPTMNGQPNGIAICTPNNYNSSSTAYQSVTINRKFITNLSQIVDNQDYTTESGNEYVIKPIKMTTYVYSQDGGTDSGTVTTPSDGSSVKAYITLNWAVKSQDTTGNGHSTITINMSAAPNGTDTDKEITCNSYWVKMGNGSASTVVKSGSSGGHSTSSFDVFTDCDVGPIEHSTNGKCVLYIQIGANFTYDGSSFDVQSEASANTFDLTRCWTTGAINAVAQENLSIPEYSHEISFKINKNSPDVDWVCKLGNRINLKYKTKTYSSIVRAFTVESDSDWYEVTCGNLSSTLNDAISSGGSSTTVSSVSSSSSSSSGGSSDAEDATSTDIDNVIGSLDF